MPANTDFRDLFIIFNDETVDYLVVGAHAAGLYTEPRYTKDLDIWVRPTPENAARVYGALCKFMGTMLTDITVDDLANPVMVYQIGVAPNRIDILMGIAGPDFETAWGNRIQATYGDVPIHVLGKEDLIRAKRAAGRPQDLLDVEKLEKT